MKAFMVISINKITKRIYVHFGVNCVINKIISNN